MSSLLSTGFQEVLQRRDVDLSASRHRLAPLAQAVTRTEHCTGQTHAHPRPLVCFSSEWSSENFNDEDDDKVDDDDDDDDNKVNDEDDGHTHSRNTIKHPGTLIS